MITYLIIMILILSLVIMKISVMISFKMKMNLEKMTPFECGFNPITNLRLPFSMRFFLITIIFLIFDVEIALLIPMIYTLTLSNLMIWLLTGMLLLIILMIGLLHEWNQGALNWL